MVCKLRNRFVDTAKVPSGSGLRSPSAGKTDMDSDDRVGPSWGSLHRNQVLLDIESYGVPAFPDVGRPVACRGEAGGVLASQGAVDPGQDRAMGAAFSFAG